jgi:hypothetical protein
MTAITTIRIDYATLPAHFDRSRPNAVAEAIEATLRENGSLPKPRMCSRISR